MLASEVNMIFFCLEGNCRYWLVFTLKFEDNLEFSDCRMILESEIKIFSLVEGFQDFHE